MTILRDYQGVVIRLTDERLGHILDHPEMAGMERAIEETLQYPQAVIQSLSDEQARLYYRLYVGTMVGDKYLCVVVKEGAADAFIVTAYLTDRVKKGGQLWLKER